MSNLAKFFRFIIFIFAAVLITIGLLASFADKPGEFINLPVDMDKLLTQEKSYIESRAEKDKIPVEQANQVQPHNSVYSYVVKSGDNLSTIFNTLLIPQSYIRGMEATDGTNNLVLDVIKEGNIITVWLDPITKQLNKFELMINPAEFSQFTRNDDDSYSFESFNLDGEWKEFTLIGKIYGSFSISVDKLGVSASETYQITQLLKEKFNFGKVRAGDRFEIIQRKQYIGDKETGKREIEAIRLYSRGTIISAYKNSDGHYYDEDGKGLQKGFRLWPTRKPYRLTSRFNPRRKHPVTGRVSPHNGEDLGTPTGTDVLATGDGEVIVVRNHPIAGKYISIKHDDTYITRYLHLSKFLVKKGDRVRAGQLIAKSGATGRITGPHLHYEFIVNGRPVSFLNTKMPMSQGLSGEDKAKFLNHVKEINAKFKAAEIK